MTGSGGTCIQISRISPRVGLGLLGSEAIACRHAGIEFVLNREIKVSVLASGFCISFSKMVWRRLVNCVMFSPGSCLMVAHCWAGTPATGISTKAIFALSLMSFNTSEGMVATCCWPFSHSPSPDRWSRVKKVLLGSDLYDVKSSSNFVFHIFSQTVNSGFSKIPPNIFFKSAGTRMFSSSRVSRVIEN